VVTKVVLVMPMVLMEVSMCVSGNDGGNCSDVDCCYVEQWRRWYCWYWRWWWQCDSDIDSGGSNSDNNDDSDNDGDTEISMIMVVTVTMIVMMVMVVVTKKYHCQMLEIFVFLN